LIRIHIASLPQTDLLIKHMLSHALRRGASADLHILVRYSLTPVIMRQMFDV
jgi:hypothetical protein